MCNSVGRKSGETVACVVPVTICDSIDMKNFISYTSPKSLLVSDFAAVPSIPDRPDKTLKFATREFIKLIEERKRPFLRRKQDETNQWRNSSAEIIILRVIDIQDLVACSGAL